MTFENDERIVMTLDAGGTNFVFSAIQANKAVVDPVRLPAAGDNLEASLNNIISGFKVIRGRLPQEPSAISLSFPGPADYPNGIIGDLVNLPAYDGVALGPMLEEQFRLPVYLNNDGDLFAYGEALAGYLPYLNNLLKKHESKQYHNLVGLTLGTGFGGGLVVRGELFLGDNSAGMEVCNIRGRLFPEFSAEEGISIRAVRRAYAQLVGEPFETAPPPSEIYRIGLGEAAGDSEAARESFRQFGVNLGDAIANILTLVDGIVVIGGGIAGARELFWEAMINELKTDFATPQGVPARRLETRVFDLENPDELVTFCRGDSKTIRVPFSDREITWDPLQRVGVALAKNETSVSVAFGAYAYALHQLDSHSS